MRGLLCFGGMMAGLENIDVTKFRKAFEWSRKQLAPFRRRRTAILQLLAGSRYGEHNLSHSQPIPLLHLLHSTYVRSLVSSNPRCLLSTRVVDLKDMAKAMEISLNHEIKEMRFAATLRQVVADALVSMGIMKVGVCYYPVEGTSGLVHDYKKPYADAISLDDWVHDMRANRFDQAGFAGHHFRVPKRMLLQDPRYKAEEVFRLTASEQYTYDEWGNVRGRSMSTDRSDGEGDHEDMLDLWEIWFPRDNIIAVFAGDSTGRLKMMDPLYVADFDGPELGPYFLLRFGEIPDNIMPAPPIPEIADLTEAMNGVFRKLIRQALRQKSITLVPGGSDPDAERINKGHDGMAIRIDGMPPQEHSYGGPRPENQQFFLMMKGIASYMAGNFDSWGGLAPQAQTLGQERLIAESASKQVQAHQDAVSDFSRDAMASMCWWWWTDPRRTYVADVPVDGQPGLTYQQPISPEDREGNWLKLNFDMDPYSLQEQGPQARLQTIMQMVQQIVLPMMPIMQQQDLAPNIAGLLSVFSRYTNMSDLAEIVMAQQPLGAEQELQEVPKMPSNTSRTYERVSRPASTGASQDLAMMQSLMGAATPQQEGMLGRSPG